MANELPVRVIAITGVTGQQGGSVLEALLNQPNCGPFTFEPRLIVRKESQVEAFTTKYGREFQYAVATFEDEAALVKAFEGAYGVFAVTPRTFEAPEEETQLGSNIAHAAKAANVSHVVWSTLEDTRKVIPADCTSIPMLYGKYRVPNLDPKADVDLIFNELGVPTSFLILGGFYENYITDISPPKRGVKTGKAFLSGCLPLDLPTGRHSVADIGRSAMGIFRQGSPAIGKYFTVATHLTMREILSAFERVMGEPFEYVEISTEEFRKFPFPDAPTLANFFQYMIEFDDVSKVRPASALCEPFEQWLYANKDKVKFTPVG